MNHKAPCTFFLIAITLICRPVMAGEFYYTLDAQGSDPNAAHFPTEDVACRKAYVTDAATVVVGPDMYILPYAPPQFLGDIPPNVKIFSCITRWSSTESGAVFQQAHFVYRNGDDCNDDEAFNPGTGRCERPDKEDDRKEMGDPTHPANVGFVSCGDPVNPANGNVYESEVDYASVAGSLRFERSYNSRAPYGGWSSTFDTSVIADTEASFRGALVKLQDGRSALFPSKNGLIRSDGGEFGDLQKVTNGWVYRSPSDDRMTFNASGDLVRWEQPGGRFLNIAVATNPPFDQVRTVTDELGQSYVYTSTLGRPSKLVVGDLTINYSFDSQRRLMEVRKTWPNHTSTRSYRYEDQRFPDKLTGIVDERGVRISTWAYDTNGRAISASMAAGTGMFQFAYDSPVQTTVTNPLGHPVRYGFTVVQGAKRITSIAGEPVAGCPAANSTFTYTPDARLATQTNGLGQVTAFSYDTQGRETSRTEAKDTPDERTTITTWDGSTFRQATVTTADRVTSYTYDAQGRPLSTTTRSLKD